MTDRDRLAQIILKARINANPLSQVGYAEADALLANGVIVPPCKVGDKVWIIHEKRIFEIMCIGFYQDPDGFYVAVANDEYSTVRWKVKYGETLFLTREEAEEKLKECEGK